MVDFLPMLGGKRSYPIFSFLMTLKVYKEEGQIFKPISDPHTQIKEQVQEKIETMI